MTKSLFARMKSGKDLCSFQKNYGCDSGIKVCGHMENGEQFGVPLFSRISEEQGSHPGQKSYC